MNLNKIILFSVIVTFLPLMGCTDFVSLSEDQIKEAGVIIGGNCSIAHGHSSQPLIVINDEVIHQDVLKSLMPNKIRSMSIIKGEKAKELYGKEGKNGVVIVKTVQKNFSSLKEE